MFGVDAFKATRGSNFTLGRDKEYATHEIGAVDDSWMLYTSVSLAAVLVELWTGGDDGLTQRFADAIRTAISESNDFSRAYANEGALVMTIPTHVYWKEVQGKINFSVVVIMIDRHRKYLGASTGSCWEADMKPCAERILADARQLWAARNEG